MKTHQFTYIFLVFSFLLSCEKDTDQAPLVESSTSGKFLASNNLASIVDGSIMVSEYEISLKKRLFSSERVVESANNAIVLSWFNGPVTYSDASDAEIIENKNLAFTFQVGEGGVFYSSFHTENHDDGFSTVDRLFRILSI